ncbi:MAG: hypothetical protein M0Z35_15790 [Desulfitobacterium hafniense]|nr:hypothetical protein [Desulfosporosinus sp.]MDA8223117.1 hypothetical protein [Desulfitobacterium hafniense]
MASAPCRSFFGLSVVIAKVLPPAVLKVNLTTLVVDRTDRGQG